LGEKKLVLSLSTLLASNKMIKFNRKHNGASDVSPRHVPGTHGRVEDADSAKQNCNKKRTKKNLNKVQGIMFCFRVASSACFFVAAGVAAVVERSRLQGGIERVVKIITSAEGAAH
jgi:hypothetical protein